MKIGDKFDVAFRCSHLLSAGGPGASSQRFEATKKSKNLSFLWFLAVDWSNRRRLQRGDSDNLETPQGVARGGSRSPRGKRSRLRKSTAVLIRLLKFVTFSVASFVARSPLSIPPAGVK